MAVDHLGVGESSQHDAERLAYTPVAAASQAAETEVRQKLAAGTLIEGLPPVEDPVTVGIGQSMGGALTIVQQGRFHCYDGIGVLGYSPLRTHPPTEPGTPPLGLPWVPRDTRPSDGVFTNGFALALSLENGGEHTGTMAWGFHYDDVAAEVVQRDMEDYPMRGGNLPGMGFGRHPHDGGAVVGDAGRRAGRSGGGAGAGARRSGRARRAGRPARRDPGLRVVAQRGLLRVPAHGPHAQLRRDSPLFWQRIQTWADWVRDWKTAGAARR